MCQAHRQLYDSDDRARRSSSNLLGCLYMVWRYKVLNFAPYTKSHCDCDEFFSNCLKRVNSSKADAVGDVFFNVLGIKCIEERLGKSCYKNTDVKTRVENVSSQSPGPGLDVRIDNGPSPPEANILDYLSSTQRESIKRIPVF